MAYTESMPQSEKDALEERHREHIKKMQEEYFKKIHFARSKDIKPE